MDEKDVKAYAANDEPPLKYEIAFPKRPLLIAGADADTAKLSSASTPRGHVTESLVDDIEWEPHVDQADKLDCIVAVSSGVLSGLIDAFFVGEFSLDRASEWGRDKIEQVVMKTARAMERDGCLSPVTGTRANAATGLGRI